MSVPAVVKKKKKQPMMKLLAVQKRETSAASFKTHSEFNETLPPFFSPAVLFLFVVKLGKNK